MDELEWYRSLATDAQRSAWAVLSELKWPQELTSEAFKGKPGTTGIGKWIQKAGYERVACRKWADGKWREEGRAPFSLYRKRA